MNPLAQNFGTNHTHWSSSLFIFSLWLCVLIPVLLLCSLASRQPSYWFPNAARTAQHPGIDDRSPFTHTETQSHYRMHVSTHITGSQVCMYIPSCIPYYLKYVLCWCWGMLMNSVLYSSINMTSHCFRINNWTIEWITNTRETLICFLFPFPC